MTNDNAILNALESLQADVSTIQTNVSTIQADVSIVKRQQAEQGNDIEDLKQDIGGIKQGQAQTNTLLEAVAAGQKELQETVATKADVLDSRNKIGKTLKNHEQRLETLEDEAGIPHSHKN